MQHGLILNSRLTLLSIQEVMVGSLAAHKTVCAGAHL